MLSRELLLTEPYGPQTMRLTHIASLSITLGLVLMPALSFSEEEPLVVSQPDPDSEIAPHVTNPVTDAAASKVPEIVKLLREKVKYVFVNFPREPRL
jgi:hypothetical protein